MTSDQDAMRFAATSEAALCTIVGIDGSFSRRCGAQLAVAPDGTMVGDMADNCLNDELASRSAEAMKTGERAVLRYGAGSPFIDFRLPCGAGIDVLIDPAPDRAALKDCADRLDARHEAALALPVEQAPGLISQRAYIPRPRLVILGSGSECAELIRLAESQGSDAEWREAGNGLSLNQRPEGIEVDPWTAILLLFHDHEWEHTLLQWALDTPAFYIGAQGGAPARESRLLRLRGEGYDDAQLARIQSPVGLIPHARDPGVLALSIMAEVVGAHEALHPHK